MHKQTNVKTPAILLLLATLVFSVASKAQSGVLRKGYAFAKQASYGREMKDLEGKTVKGPDSVYFLYLEIKGPEKPQINGVTFNGKKFTASVVFVEEKKVEAGKTTGQKTITLQRATGYSFWRIELTPADEGKSNSSSKGLVVSGKAGKRPFVFTAPKWTVLTADITG